MEEPEEERTKLEEHFEEAQVMEREAGSKSND